MTAKEYMEIAKRKGNERVCELIKFLQDNGYDYSEFDIGVLVSGHIRPVSYTHLEEGASDSISLMYSIQDTSIMP